MSRIMVVVAVGLSFSAVEMGGGPSLAEAKSLTSRIRRIGRRISRQVRRTRTQVRSQVRRTSVQVRTQARRTASRVRQQVRRVGSQVRRVTGQIRNQAQRIRVQAQNALRSLEGRVRNELRRFGNAAGKTFREIAQGAVDLVVGGGLYAYLEANRAAYLGRGKPLTATEISSLSRHFPRRLLDRVRVLELSGRTGFLTPGSAGTTYGNDFFIIKKGSRTLALLLHEMVHVCQYDRFGIQGFARRYTQALVESGFSYRGNKLEKQAFDFENQYRAGRAGHISRHLGYCAN